jgi:RNA polymerase sigma-70 factor (ECF subfamily)
MPHLRSNPKLLARFRAGERAAMEEVCRLYLPDVDAYLRTGLRGAHGGVRVTALASPADHADVVQEVLVRALKPEARLAYDGVRDYRPYIANIARNVLADHHRRRAREPVVPSRGSWDATELADAKQAPAEDVPAHGWLEPRARAIAQDYVAELSGELRAVYEARFVHARTQRDAAEQLGVSRKMIRMLEERMHRELRVRLSKAGIRDSNVTPESASHG